MFFVPFLFTIKTHYNSKNKIFVYFITYLVPLFLLSFLQNFPDVRNYSFYAIFLISLVSYVNFYEIGYIYNECETIKKETNPTKRLSQRHLDFYENHKFWIYTERFVLTVVLNFALLLFTSKRAVVLFSSAEIISLLIFIIYNNVRGKVTQLIYFFLSFSKYSSIIFIHPENLSASVFLAALFIFPIVRTIEYKAHYGKESNVNVLFRKYIIKYDVSKITVFRVWATLILLCVSVALYFLKICNLIPAICCAYIFLYRFALFVAIKCGAKFRGYLKTDKEFSDKKGNQNV